MQEINNSVLLIKLLEKANSYPGGPSGPLTAEKLVASAIEMLKAPAGELREDERLELQPLSEFFEKRGANMSEVWEKLRFHILGKSGTTFDDVMYVQGKLLEAKVQARKDNQETVTADAVLLCILREPSETLRACMGSAPAAVPGEKTGKPKSDDDEEKAKQALLASIRRVLDDKKEPRSAEAEPKAESGQERPFGGAAEKECDTEAPQTSKDRISSLVDFVIRTRSALLEKVFGQDNAVSIFTNGYFQGELASLTDKQRRRPRATFLFAGPPGVGKTFLAETAAEVLGLPYMRFDMSEYSDKEAVVQLCGSDAVYKDSRPGILSGFVSKHPKCILLFDEIEKAHVNAIHLFLQILDAGRLTDAKTRKEVSFADAIVIFTTNAGKKLYEESESEDLSGVSRKVILQALEKDTNPETGVPYFPAAICSRFASGNVVMFNHMSAHNLRAIARSVITRQVGNLEREVGIRSEIDENVYTALLLAEGGTADARMIRGRAESFYNEELFELFRLIDSDKAKTNIAEVEDIHFTVQLPESSAEIRELFETPDDTNALVFAPQKDVDWCRRSQSACCILGTQSIEEGTLLLQEKDVQFVMLDLDLLLTDEKEEYLNIEDIESDARDFLWFVREKHPHLPVFLLIRKRGMINEEEQLSFRRIGVQGFLNIGDDGDSFADRVYEICEHLHQQQNITSLARRNRLVSFETRQRLSPDGKKAEICLFDFEFSTAVDAEDSKNVLSSVSRPNVHFADVIGAEDAKKELTYFVEYLKNPKKYIGTGVSAPKGVILYGPPGTGKTMLAKAMACEADVTFLAAEGNQFLKKYVGEGPAAVHDLFRAARKYAPSILFVDEIDAIAKQRTGSDQSEAREEILTAFLTEMDGFRVDPAKPVFVLAATNFDVEPGQQTSLDSALMRRFDRRIFVDLPNKEERIRYLTQQFGKKPIFHVSERMIDNIAVRSTGMSLASLASVIELSLRMAVREGGLQVTDAVFEEAFETFNSGEAKKWDASELERTARHEAGHALLSWLSGDKPSYLTIVARSNHGGYMQHGDSESKAIYTKEDLLARIRTALAGRAAEIVYYGAADGTSTGASGDLSTATGIARNIICTYGMDESFGLAVIGPTDTGTPEVREAINRILKSEMEKAIASVAENRPRIDAIVEVLMSKNSLTGEEIDSIFSAER